MFADDVKLFSKIISLDDASVLQVNLNRLHEWTITNKLTINMSKYSIMLCLIHVRKIL